MLRPFELRQVGVMVFGAGGFWMLRMWEGLGSAERLIYSTQGTLVLSLCCLTSFALRAVKRKWQSGNRSARERRGNEQWANGSMLAST